MTTLYGGWQPSMQHRVFRLTLPLVRVTYITLCLTLKARLTKWEARSLSPQPLTRKYGGCRHKMIGLGHHYMPTNNRAVLWDPLSRSHHSEIPTRQSVGR